ncbi:endoribonuclease l-psp family [Fusarium heterosporum]|uniref:Endoribonuclease l-psp family n=1 Tax=Fusarium heterosporum TaxID=42747 RepID=A0A8H5TNE9_FUSHE|nr:endoribonuclease l-psp family [Fusarium heterosporum]
MASFSYITPPGFLEVLSDANHYSQAVDLGNGIFKISGQGGFSENGEFPSDVKQEVEQTIQNVDHVLKAAGLRGTLPLMTELLKERIPDNRPGSVVAGIARLALPVMRIEIEVDAKKQAA